jgi:hypothetical protein
MRRAPGSALPEKALHLWALAASPAIWAAHFLLSYATAAVWCAKVAGAGGPLAGARVAIGAFTAVALGAIAIVGWGGYRRHRHGDSPAPHDDDTPEDRHRFLGLATAMLSGLSAVATVYSALAAVFIGSCR